MGTRGLRRRGENSFDERSDDEEVAEKKSTKAFRGRNGQKRACQVEEMGSTEKPQRRSKRYHL